MQKLRLLLAEDDADDQYVFMDFLKDRVDIAILPFADNGVEVLKYLDKIQDLAELPDLIILDHNMPKMNGTETLVSLKANDRYAGIPVFIYSTYADKLLIEKCRELGAVSIETKPFTKKGYQSLIDDCLKNIAA